MRFEAPFAFLLLLPVIGLGALLWLRSQRPAGLKFSNVRQAGQAAPAKPWGPDEVFTLLVLAGLTLAVIALARPQFGTTTEQISGQGVDIVLCLDTSGSMRSEDFKPQNRLGAAKEVARAFIPQRPNDRIGLVVFGGIALTICPLTTDKRALLELLDQVQIDMTSADGTAVGMALVTAAERLKASQAKSKVVILLTDGRNNQGAIDPLTAAKAAAALGIKIYTVGAGSPEGGLMPVQDPIFGTRYVRLENDLDENVLRAIASTTNGLYYRAKDSHALGEIFEQINRLEKSEYQVTQFTHYRDWYFGWLLAGFLLLALAYTLRQTVFRRIP